MAEEQRFNELLERYLANKITPEEYEKLMSMLKSDAHDQTLKDEIELSLAQDQSNIHIDPLRAKEIIYNIISSEKSNVPVVPLKPKRLTFLRIAVAASVIGLILLGTYFWFNREGPGEVAQTEVKGNGNKNDIAPPALNRATITLANGQKVYLDSAANGTLATQGNITVKKLADGQIVYNGESSRVNNELVYNTLTNPRGSKVINITLNDGSKVWLNAGSSVTYPVAFAGNERKVTITGEGYFEVAKDREKPFFVHTKAFDIKVLGTGFNVRAYPDEDRAVTALVHGSVEVIVGDKEKRNILLRPNEKVTLPTNGVKENSAEMPNGQQAVSEQLPVKEKMTLVQDTVQLETAWVSNKLAFKKMQLENITSLLEKWFGTEIRFKNEDKKLIKLSGVYNGENLDEILYSLELASGSSFHYEKDRSGVIWIK